MRILIFTPYIGANYGGIGKAVRGIASGLGSQGVDVDVVTTDANNLEKMAILLNRWIDDNNYKIRYFPCWHKHDFVWSWSLISWLIGHLQDYDLVHTNTVFAPIVSFVHYLCRIKGIPYIMTPHGMLEPWALSYKAVKKRLYYNFFEKQLLEKANAIHVIADREAKNINSLGLHNIATINNGIYCHKFTKLPDAEVFYQKFPATRNKRIILFLGRIDPKKGLDLLALAFGQVYSKFPQTHLVIAGPNSIGYLKTVQDYFAHNACLDAVTFTGMLTGELKYAALAAANLYIAPSYSEGFSISILEGMAAGKPCIITTGCNFPEAAHAQAACVVEINALAIEYALIECLSHPEQAQKMGARAREFIVQNYTWESAAQKLVEVYKAVLNRTLLDKYNLSLSSSNTHQR
jgi:glycosyltransferase involved in cell wall biosynthesis